MCKISRIAILIIAVSPASHVLPVSLRAGTFYSAQLTFPPK